ncbi:MAG TPA: hypothetical protein VFT06_04115 [Flavisolibacter sp.]|nr:hypothetical protein [Flavisolibacter sp.]
MKEEQDYIRDIAEIRTMMERSSKFLSLSGWAGILAGIYALAGAYIAYKLFNFNPDTIVYSPSDAASVSPGLLKVILLATGILLLAISTAVVLSNKQANKRGEKVWNATSRRLLVNMAVPLVTGGILILILISKGLIGLIAPLTLLFYGLALFNASKVTYAEVKFLGLIQMGLGLLSAYFVSYSLLFWALGFGLLHIIYGIYLHFKYER